MGDSKSLLALDDLRDIYALAIHNIKASKERQENQFLVVNKGLVRNHIRYV